MKLYIDNREPNDIIENINNLNNKAKVKFEIINCNLPLFDYIISNEDFDINNLENNLENIIVAIERKSENDLLSSVKDGRYREQSYRMEYINIPKKNIYYLIEESKTRLSDVDKKIIQSAQISLSYFKNFSLFFTKSKLESSNFIYKFLDKINSNTLENKKNTEKVNNIDDNNINDSINDDDNNNINDYLSSIKVSKKSNITPENIDIIMLMQIPNISNNIASCLINEYKSINNLVNLLEKDNNILDNIKVNNRKISKTVINNILTFLHII